MCLVVPVNFQADRFSQWKEKNLFFNLHLCILSEGTMN